MGIKFGSKTGRRERLEYRLDEADLQCGKEIYSYLRTIEKTLSIDDEFFTCSIGIILPEGVQVGIPDCTNCPGICIEEITVRIREDQIQPKYKPKEVYNLNQVISLSNDGTAILDLGCDIMIRRAEIEVTARYKSDGTTNIPLNVILNCSTSDKLYSVLDLLGFNPLQYVKSQTVRSKSIDKPTDDFWTQEITYIGRVGYPDDVTVDGTSGLSFRDLYINAILGTVNLTRNDNLWPTPDGIVNMRKSTIESTLTMRFDNNPTRRIVITTYSVPTINN